MLDVEALVGVCAGGRMGWVGVGVGVTVSEVVLLRMELLKGRSSLMRGGDG